MRMGATQSVNLPLRKGDYANIKFVVVAHVRVASNKSDNTDEVV